MIKTPHTLRFTLYAHEPNRRDMSNVETRPLFRRCQMWRPDPYSDLPNVEQYS